MATRKVYKKTNRKHKGHNKSKHGKRKTRKVNRKNRRQQKGRANRVIHGGAASPFPPKEFNVEKGGHYYPVNKNVTTMPESERFGNIAVTPSVYNNHGNPDVVMKDLPIPQAGGRRHKHSAVRKSRRGRKTGNKNARKSRQIRRKRRSMKGGSAGSTVCPSCPSSNGVSTASPSFSDFVPQTVLNAYRGVVDTVENTNNALAGKPPITDNSDISDQVIAKNIPSTPPSVNMPPNVGKIVSESQMAVAKV